MGKAGVSLHLPEKISQALPGFFAGKRFGTASSMHRAEKRTCVPFASTS